MNMNKLYFLSSIFLSIIISGCTTPDPNKDDTGNDELQVLEVDPNIVTKNMVYRDLIYVPIYSDIYLDELNQESLLAATLSIRNTSFKDSIFISTIDYYNTSGERVKRFINNTISLPPMATLNYVIEKEDDTGGPGANFIIELSAHNTNVKPLIQAIMIGEKGNQAFSFATDGYSVK
jgi:hypothetical protein